MNFLFESTVEFSLIALVALAAGALLRKRSAAMRHWVLAVALTCAAVTPLLGLVAPSWHLPMTRADAPPSVERFTAARIDRTATAAGDVAQAFTFRESREQEANRTGPPSAVSVADVLWSIWLAGIAASLFVLLVGLGRLSWIAARAAPVTDLKWTEAAANVSRAYGLRRPVRLLRSAYPTLLVTWGLLQSKVILPVDAGHWTDDRIRIVLGHELAHIRRGDWIVQLAVQLLRAMHWFNPLVWIASTRLRQESEQACDDAVLSLGVEGSTYATHLLELARAFRNERRMWPPAPAIARPSSLERRVSAMLNARVNRDPVTRPASVAASIALLAITIVVAGFSASAQMFSTVSGSVVDQHGALLPGVTLVLTSAQTQQKYEVRSSQTGQFEFVGIPAGDFTLTAQFPGFRTLQDRVSVAGRNLQRDLTLQIGTLEETITVNGAPPTGRAAGPAVTEQDRARFRQALERCTVSASGGTPAIGGKIRPPIKIRHVRPEYPEGLRAARIGGTVKLDALIGADGRVKEVRPLDNLSVDPGLIAAAIGAVNEWEFDGTLLNCVPVEVEMTVSVYFNPEQ